ncbi:MAG: hypothetical protein ACLFS5_01795 [Spirochaetaceae bacterium]
MPDWMYVIIVSIAVPAAIVLVWALIRRGGQLKFGQNAIIVEGKRHDANSPVARVVDYVQRSTPELQHKLLRVYLRLLKDAGADPDRLGEYDDARFVRMLLAYMVNGGNGTRSVQKIVESEVVGTDWHGRDLREYVRAEVWPPILRSVKDLVNREYDTEVLSVNGAMRRRWVSSTAFIDALSADAVRDMVVDEIVPLFEYARGCLEIGCRG